MEKEVFFFVGVVYIQNDKRGDGARVRGRRGNMNEIGKVIAVVGGRRI